MKQYADWKAPKTDAAHLIWPEPAEIRASTLQNARQLSSLDARIQNTPIKEIRAAVRRAVMGNGDESPIVATGHQVEMYHPGVWVKNLFIDSVAKSVGGRALHLAVDTDSPKHLQLRWPGGSVLMSDDAAIVDGAWSGLVASPSASHVQKILTSFAKASAEWNFTPAIGPFFDEFKTLSLQSPEKPLVRTVLAATSALDRSLGIDVPHAVASDFIDTDGYLALAHHLVADAERFAKHYNDALAAYRKAEGIDSPQRPMPDLLIEPKRVELPFWLDDLGARERFRATAIATPQGWALEADESFVFDRSLDARKAAERLRAYLKQNGLRLSPRALTLTMFFRLLLVDQFVHGIGGGRYDQVTDRIIETYFGVEAPAFSVTTATMFFPEAGEQTPICVPCIVTEGHRLRHNLIATKPQHLAAIGAAPRKSNERKSRYLAMHRELAMAAETTDAIPDWRRKLETALARQSRESVLFDRELFYGIQTRERLTAMIDRYRIAFQ